MSWTNRRNSAKVNATGRNVTDRSRFARLDHRILSSNAYRALSPNDRSLLVELIMLFNGDNNGSLYLSVRDAAHRMGVADLSAAARSFDTLQSLGFIELTVPSKFRSGSSGKSRARCWRLTWLAGPGRKTATWDFLNREPEPQTMQRKRMERGLRALKRYRRAKETGKLPVLDSDTLSTFGPNASTAPVLETNTPKRENGGFPPNFLVRDSATHIATPWGAGATSNPIGWWQPDWSPSYRAWAFARMVDGTMRHEIQNPRAA